MTAVSVGGRAVGLPAATVQRTVQRVLAGERASAAISITFLGLSAMRRLNQAHTSHDWPTDVLSFALVLPDGRLAGDIYICRAVALRNARTAAVPLKEEMIRLVVHGVLHVLGYDHPEVRGRERSAMWRKQERYVRKVLLR